MLKQSCVKNLVLFLGTCFFVISCSQSSEQGTEENSLDAKAANDGNLNIQHLQCENSESTYLAKSSGNIQFPYSAKPNIFVNIYKKDEHGVYNLFGNANSIAKKPGNNEPSSAPIQSKNPTGNLEEVGKVFHEMQDDPSGKYSFPINFTVLDGTQAFTLECVKVNPITNPADNKILMHIDPSEVAILSGLCKKSNNDFLDQFKGIHNAIKNSFEKNRISYLKGHLKCNYQSARDILSRDWSAGTTIAVSDTCNQFQDSLRTHLNGALDENRISFQDKKNLEKSLESICDE